MGFFSYLGNGFRILAFNRDAVQAIVNDPESKKYSFFVTAFFATFAGLVGFLVGFVFSYFLGSSSFGLFPSSLTKASPVILGFLLFFLVFLFMIVSAGITHFLARAFGGNASIFQFYAVMMALGMVSCAVSTLSTVLDFIPILGLVLRAAITVYMIVLFIFIVRETYVLSSVRAFFVWFIPALVITLLVAGMMVYAVSSLTSDGFVPTGTAGGSGTSTALMPDKCILQGGGLSCTDYGFIGNTVWFAVANNGGQNVESVTVKFTSRSGCADIAPTQSVPSLMTGASARVYFPCTPSSGTRVSGELSVTYTPSGHSLAQVATGQVTIKAP